MTYKFNYTLEVFAIARCRVAERMYDCYALMRECKSKGTEISLSYIEYVADLLTCYNELSVCECFHHFSEFVVREDKGCISTH